MKKSEKVHGIFFLSLPQHSLFFIACMSSTDKLINIVERVRRCMIYFFFAPAFIILYRMYVFYRSVNSYSLILFPK